MDAVWRRVTLAAARLGQTARSSTCEAARGPSEPSLAPAISDSPDDICDLNSATKLSRGPAHQHNAEKCGRTQGKHASTRKRKAGRMIQLKVRARPKQTQIRRSSTAF
jgi:hypothetical protein